MLSAAKYKDAFSALKVHALLLVRYTDKTRMVKLEEEYQPLEVELIEVMQNIEECVYIPIEDFVDLNIGGDDADQKT